MQCGERQTSFGDMNATDTETKPPGTDTPAVLTLTVPLPDLPRIIRARLAFKQKSAAWLAGQLGISPTSVSHRMSGKIPWTVTDLTEAAAHLDITLQDLVHGSAVHDALAAPAR